jgi:hypothetical protein
VSTGEHIVDRRFLKIAVFPARLHEKGAEKPVPSLCRISIGNPQRKQQPEPATTGLIFDTPRVCAKAEQWKSRVATTIAISRT